MPAADVVDLIMADHREVERLFELGRLQKAASDLDGIVSQLRGSQ